MTNQKEYTNVDGSDDKKRGVSFKILSGVAAAIALSSGGYHLLHSSNNSPQSVVSMTSMNVLRSSTKRGCDKNQDCGLHYNCANDVCSKCPENPPRPGCGSTDTYGCKHDRGERWCASSQTCIRGNCP